MHDRWFNHLIQVSVARARILAGVATGADEVGWWVLGPSRGIGAPTISILLRHILPHLLSTVLVMLTLTLPRVVLMEAFLSFLGLGVEAPDVSWGILAREGLETLNPLVDCWWILALPGMALTLTLLALQRLGDGLRDALSSPVR